MNWRNQDHFCIVPSVSLIIIVKADRYQHNNTVQCHVTFRLVNCVTQCQAFNYWCRFTLLPTQCTGHWYTTMILIWEQCLWHELYATSRRLWYFGDLDENCQTLRMDLSGKCCIFRFPNIPFILRAGADSLLANFAKYIIVHGSRTGQSRSCLPDTLVKRNCAAVPFPCIYSDKNK